MPLLVLIGAALAAAFAAARLAFRAQRHLADAPRVAAAETRRHPRLRAAVARRLSGGRVTAAEATGAALFAAFVVTVAGVLVVGVLALALRRHAGATGIDSLVADWGRDEASTWSTDVIEAITHLGETWSVVVVALAALLVTIWRSRDRAELWTLPFLVVVIAGNSALYNLLKELMDRTRPAFEASTASLGPSFPSGHSATAAAGYAAIAFALARRAPATVRAVYAGVAVGIAVAVAASRVMLGVHWLTDTICGLALGWAWCAVVVVAFGGRLLRFGGTAEAMQRAVGAAPSRQ